MKQRGTSGCIPNGQPIGFFFFTSKVGRDIKHLLLKASFWQCAALRETKSVIKPLLSICLKVKKYLALTNV